MHSPTQTAFAVILSLSITPAIFAQGTVIFDNTPSTLFVMQSGPPTTWTPVSAPAGSYYFGLLISPSYNGPFTFTGNYATNSGTAGQLVGGTQVVNGWAPGASMWYEVAGWSSNLGPTFQPGWLVGDFGGVQEGFFGTQIAPGTAGTPTAPFPLYGAGTGLFSEMVLQPISAVPEPSTTSLIAVGAGVLLFSKSRQKAKAEETEE